MCARPQPVEIFRGNEEINSAEDKDRQFFSNLIDAKKQFRVPTLDLTSSKLFIQRRTCSYPLFH